MVNKGIMRKKKIAIIGTAGVPSRYGGFETLAHHLVKNLEETFHLSVYCSKVLYKKEERVNSWNGARLIYLPFSANGIQSIIYDIASMIHALFFADVLIVLGVSGGIFIPVIKLFTRKKVIVNIDGLEWRRDKWSKPVKKFLKLSERLAVKFSDADVTDNAAIKRYTAMYYKTLSHQIEYGGDHCQKVKLIKSDYAEYDFLKYPYAFKVCRIEPENNVHIILNAFAALPSKTLVMIGNWQNSAYGIELFEKFSQFENIHLLDPIYDQQKLDKIRFNCYVYLHGHSAGGTNPSLVEAMYLNLPVIAFDVSYNRATTEDKALFFKDESSLQELLETTSLSQYTTVKKALKLVADKKYTWSIIAQKYAQLVYCFDHDYQKSSVRSKISRLEETYLIGQGLGHLKRSRLFYEEL